MVGQFQRLVGEDALLPGLAADYRETPVQFEDYAALLEDPCVLAALAADEMPLPTTAAREGYFGDRHLEYWLSGFRDAASVMACLGLTRESAVHVLDFGGASGRLARHLVREMPNGQHYLADINSDHVRTVQRIFGRRITALATTPTPHLPFRDAAFDLVTAFSVFTHIASLETAWLLELDRVIGPGGHLYATIHDEQTWRNLRELPFASVCLSNGDFAAYYADNPDLHEPVIHFYNTAETYNCNVFHTRAHIEEVWGSIFEIVAITSLAHEHQAAVVMRSRT